MSIENFPTQKYSIIYADPPYSYASPSIRGAASKHYSTMCLDDIKNLSVPAICEDNCVLFCWVTFPLLQEGLDVIKSWGFEYKTIGFSWTKLNKKDNKPFFGTGYYTRSNSEACLIGIKGKPVRIANNVSSIIQTVRGEHSAKPPIVRDKIVELYGDISRIELFAREKVEGWDHWGNEV